MTIPSNLYAEKVFAEQPLALWSFDEDVYFGSLILPEDRDLDTWTISGGTLSTSSSMSAPIADQEVFRVLGDVPTLPGENVEIKSGDIFQNEDLTAFYGDAKTLAAYFYISSPYITSIDIGFEMDGTEYVNNFPISILNQWLLLSKTQDGLPTDPSKIIFRVNYISGGATTNDYEFYISSLSLGQWSEEFSAVSVGVDALDLPESIDVAINKGVPAKAYGIQNLDAYYLADGRSMVSRNTGVPLVYGASSVTSIVPIQTFSGSDYSSDPSLIVPGLGFLNESGKNNEYTAEFWIRLNPSWGPNSGIDQLRIFGPINSSDGIYVTNSTISIRVGQYSGTYNYSNPNFRHQPATPYVGSYSVGEWNRPMLIDFKLSNSLASLSINGETVISIDIDLSSISFPGKYVRREDLLFLDPAISTEDANARIGKEQDWLGFYGSTHITPFEIDCVAIYPYIVPDTVSKRRFVYGQGVEFPENLNNAYSGTSIYADFSFSNYDNSYNYPEIGAWNQGILENFVTDKKTLSFPEYVLPEISFNNKTNEIWNSLSYDNFKSSSFVQKPISLYPDESWIDDGTQGFIYFKDLLLSGNATVAAFFAKINGGEPGETLFYIKDKASNDFFEITTSVDGPQYSITINGDTTELDIESSPRFYVGIDIKTFSSNFGGNVYEFLNRSSLSMYVGGRPDYTQTFTGQIYSVGICSNYNLSRIADLFDQDGTMNTDTIQKQDYLATYDLQAKVSMGSYKLTIGASSYWEDYVPLTTLATYVDDSLGNQTYDLSSIQINAHSLLSQEGNSYIGDTVFGDIVIDEDIIDRTKDLPIRIFVLFRYNSSSSPQDVVYYRNSKNKVLDLSLDDKWQNSKYEIVDGTIIYPPSNININDLSLVVRIEGTNSSLLDYPVDIKSLQITSRSLSATTSNPIGTRFGNEIYPYKKSGLYYDYTAKNPISITKSSTPHLYLTSKTGIESVGDLDTTSGISVPVNANRSQEYNLIGIQSFVRLTNYIFEKSEIPEDFGIELFEIEAKNANLKVYMSPISDNYPGDMAGSEQKSYKRARVYCVNVATGLVENGVSFFWNGKIVKNPILTANEWGVLGVGFSNTLDFSNYSGKINISGPIMFNSLSYYGSTNLQELQRRVFNNWLSVSGSGTIDWNFWLGSYIWDDVLAVMTNTNRKFSLSDVYNAYMGTNKLIVTDSEELTLGNYEYTIFTNAGWQTYAVSPV